MEVTCSLRALRPKVIVQEAATSNLNEGGPEVRCRRISRDGAVWQASKLRHAIRCRVGADFHNFCRLLRKIRGLGRRSQQTLKIGNVGQICEREIAKRLAAICICCKAATDSLLASMYRRQTAFNSKIEAKKTAKRRAAIMISGMVDPDCRYVAPSFIFS
jgi:hypothetical protein